MSRIEFDAIGTSWEIDTPVPLGVQMRRRIDDLIEAFDCNYSRFRDNSLITRIAKAESGGTFEFPLGATDMFDLYDRLYDITDGAVDPLVGRDLELLGYDRHYTLTPSPFEIAAYNKWRPCWADDVARKGSTLVTRRPLMIDVGAVGKGYLVDLLSRVLIEAGVEEFTVDASGDMVQVGETTLDVGLEHPLDPSLVVGVAHMRNAALCASAINRRKWADDLHHIVDGRTGRPVKNVIATWVVAQNAATADGLATALFFTPASRLTRLFEFSSVRMFANGSIEMSDNFEGEIFA